MYLLASPGSSCFALYPAYVVGLVQHGVEKAFRDGGDLSKRWYQEEGPSAVQIAKRLGRSPSTVSRLVIKRRPLKVQGRKPLLSKGKVDKLVAKLVG